MADTRVSNIDKAALLASVRDIHEPSAPEPGWPWLLAAIALGLALLVVLWKNRPRKVDSIATQQINAARIEPPSKALIRLARLLRSDIVQPDATAGKQVHGDAWLQVLDTQFRTSFFTDDIGRVFGQELYQKPLSDINIETLCDQLQRLLEGKQRA